MAVYTVEEVNGMLAEKEAKIAQLTEMLKELAAKHDALAKRFEDTE